jgi:nitroimidazol reductase NimA-like FMN-containing flavoprotein (pyridoxamine 5'-phosphate oxidase superfamily)
MAPERVSHRELDTLTTAECIRLLRDERVGRVAFASPGGMVHVIPVNFVADDEGRVVFRTSWTTLLNTVALSAVAFEIDGFDDAGRTGWSVCVHGFGREITEADDPAATALRALAVEPWAPGDRNTWLTVIPMEITGRRLRINPDAADGGWWFPGIPTS